MPHPQTQPKLLAQKITFISYIFQVSSKYVLGFGAPGGQNLPIPITIGCDGVCVCVCVCVFVGADMGKLYLSFRSSVVALLVLSDLANNVVSCCQTRNMLGCILSSWFTAK